MAQNSGRFLRDADKKRMLDIASRKRRARKALEALEQDNFHEDPHADLTMSKKVPKFQDNIELRTRKRKLKTAEYYRTRFRKTLQQMIDEDQNSPREINYTTAQAEPSAQPDRHFCAVCGFPSNYTCTMCGTRYCCDRCLKTHQDTRCLKWTA